MTPRPGTASSHTLTLDQLAARVKTGDETAARDLFNALWPQCVKHGIECLRFRADGRFDVQAAAEDIAARTLTSAFKRMEDYDPSIASVATWVKQFVSNAATDHLRKSHTRHERLAQASPEDDDETADPMDNRAERGPSDARRLLAREVANEILDVVFSLRNARYRDCLVAHWVLLMPYETLAAFSGVTETAVRSTVCRALKAFEQDFRAKLPDYRDADIDALAGVLKEGSLHITAEQIDRLPAADARAIRACVDGAAGGDGAMNANLRAAVAALVKLRPRRAPRPADEDAFGRLLSAAGTAALGTGAQQEPVGTLLARAAAATTPGKLVRALDIDIHELNALFNNAVPPALARHAGFIGRLAAVLGVSRPVARAALAAARPPALAGVTRSSSARRRMAALRRVVAITAGNAHARQR